nr:golgin subfamily A member 6-like protein 6 [Arachis hypogaea]
MGGGISKQQGWREEGEEQAREQLNPDRESGEEQSSKESRIRDERVLQQKIREESVWENQMRREEEMADAEEQEERDMQRDLGAAYKLSNLIKEIRERNNEWANNKKAQKGERRYEVQKSGENGQIRNIRPNTKALHQQAWNVEGNGMNNYITEEEEEVNSYKMEDWKTEGKENQELLKGGTEENALRKLSKEAQNGEHEFVGQHVKPGENVYYVELASDEDGDKGMEVQTDWETRLAKKLELKLNLKRKRENKQVPLLIYREWKEEQEDREPKKVKNSITALGTGEYQLAKHVSSQIKGIQMVEEVDLNMPQPQP